MTSLRTALATLAVVFAVSPFSLSPANAAIMATADPAYDTSGAAFTVDPEAVSSAVFTFNSSRLMRQTFQTNATVNVDSLVFALRTTNVGTDSVVTVNLYEVADVTSGSWAPGSPVASFDFTPVETSSQTGVMLSGNDRFTLPERSAGVAGYGIEFDLNDDNTTYAGSMAYSNTGADEYATGQLFGPFSRPDGDFGLSISGSAIPEPSTVVLLGMLSGIGMLTCRRRG